MWVWDFRVTDRGLQTMIWDLCSPVISIIRKKTPYNYKTHQCYFFIIFLYHPVENWLNKFYYYFSLFDMLGMVRIPPPKVRLYWKDLCKSKYNFLCSKFCSLMARACYSIHLSLAGVPLWSGLNHLENSLLRRLSSVIRIGSLSTASKSAFEKIKYKSCKENPANSVLWRDFKIPTSSLLAFKQIDGRI